MHFDDHTVAIGQSTGGLVQEVAALVVYLAMRSGNRLAGTFPAMGTAFAPGKMLLGERQFLLPPAVVAWVLNSLTRRERGKPAKQRCTVSGNGSASRAGYASVGRIA